MARRRAQAGRAAVSTALTLWQPGTLTPHVDRSLTVGVRAEDLHLGEGPPGAGRIAARVFAVEPLGAETLLALEVEGMKAEITARLGRDVAARVGEQVVVHFEPSAVHLFDPATTLAIARDA
jgi:multiple sugar transport system ATP-binding protein